MDTTKAPEPAAPTLAAQIDLIPLAGPTLIGREAEALHPAAQVAADALGSTGHTGGKTVHLSRDLWRAAYLDGDTGRSVTIHAPQELASGQIAEATEAIEREAPRFRVAPHTGHGFTCWTLRPRTAGIALSDFALPAFRVSDANRAHWSTDEAGASAIRDHWDGEIRRFDSRTQIEEFAGEIADLIRDGGEPRESDVIHLERGGIRVRAALRFDSACFAGEGK